MAELYYEVKAVGWVEKSKFGFRKLDGRKVAYRHKKNNNEKYLKSVKVFVLRIALQVLKFLLIKHDIHIAVNQVLGEY